LTTLGTAQLARDLEAYGYNLVDADRLYIRQGETIIHSYHGLMEARAWLTGYKSALAITAHQIAEAERQPAVPVFPLPIDKSGEASGNAWICSFCGCVSYMPGTDIGSQKFGSQQCCASCYRRKCGKS